jgi:endonuclease/exonuclease/phosphatase family metal-dependent hydrolase
MPTIFDTPPLSVQNDLASLTAALDLQIPPKTINNFLIATWNLRSFGSLTRKWTAASSDSPKRDLRGLRSIIEIVSRFDVVAIQEVKGNLRSLRDMLKYLLKFGDWGFLMTDVNIGAAGNDERFLFIYDRTRLRPSGLAAELVVPSERLNISPDALTTQFARSPYTVSFQRANTTIIFVTLHVLFGDREADRIAELREIADWMRDWANRSNSFHHNLLTLGDFNIDRQGSEGYDAFTSTGLAVPDVLLNLPRTIFDDPGDPNDDKFYDQIAWFSSGSRALIDLHLHRGGNFNFMPFVYTDTTLSRNSISYRVSDHYPLWVEFQL